MWTTIAREWPSINRQMDDILIVRGAIGSMEVTAMFVFHCPRHQADVLIWPSDIDGIDNTADGIDVHFHCGCGMRGVLQTGAARTERIVVATAV